MMIVCLDAQSISTKSQPNIFDNHGCKENLEDTKLFFVRNHIVHSKAGTRNFIRVFDCIYQRGGENHRYEIYLFMFIFFLVGHTAVSYAPSPISCNNLASVCAFDVLKPKFEYKMDFKNAN